MLPDRQPDIQTDRHAEVQRDKHYITLH